MANLLSEFSSVRGFHAFFIDSKKKSVRFDVVVDFAEKNLGELRAQVERRVAPAWRVYSRALAVCADFTRFL